MNLISSTAPKTILHLPVHRFPAGKAPGRSEFSGVNARRLPGASVPSTPPHPTPQAPPPLSPSCVPPKESGAAPRPADPGVLRAAGAAPRKRQVETRPQSTRGPDRLPAARCRLQFHIPRGPARQFPLTARSGAGSAGSDVPRLGLLSAVQLGPAPRNPSPDAPPRPAGGKESGTGRGDARIPGSTPVPAAAQGAVGGPAGPATLRAPPGPGVIPAQTS